MDINIAGRIKNVNLNYSKVLLPLFEAIINSIHAIEEKQIKDGLIEIRIIRDDTQRLTTPDDYEQNPVKSFVIVDNGIGFNSSNYKSFITADSTYKIKKGAKGIGRFLWLKAFNYVHIESKYSENNKFFQRSFNFKATENGIETHKINEIDKFDSNNTIVYLEELKSEYSAHCPKKTELICRRIVEHTLVYFLDNDCPEIYVFDNQIKFNLKHIFQEKFKKHSEKQSVQIKKDSFEITYLKLYGSEEHQHIMHLCADKREVKKENYSKYLPDLNKKIKDEEENPYVLSSYISSSYLDKKVNSERTDFLIPQDGNKLYPDEITQPVLIQGLIESTRKHFQILFDKLKEEKTQQIETFVRTKAPEYRALLKYKDNILDKIQPDLSEEKLDVELHKATHKIELDLKEKSLEILKTDISTVDDLDTYKEKYNEFLSDFNEFGKTKLSQYIIHRRLILELLSKNLQKDNNSDKYSLEESVHKIIFPLKKTSDDIDYEKQNLWIIDEKLAFHRYLASDKPINSMGILKNDNLQRPDIVIFNEPFAFVEDDAPFSSVVLIEFKRPMRNDYTDDDENPVSQIYDYVEKIMSGKALDNNGRPVIINKNTPFYGYAICDITPSIQKVARRYSLTESPDNLGYFGYNKDYKTYFEILSYDKLLNDAKRRNQILFDKLNLPKF